MALHKGLLMLRLSLHPLKQISPLLILVRLAQITCTMDNTYTAVQESEVDGMTLVWCPGMGDKWLNMSEINGLKQLLQATQAMDDGDDSTNSTTAAVAGQYDISEMMFAGSSDASAQPVLDAESAAALASKKRKEAGKKRFTSDDGVKYTWDDATDDWIEAGSDDEGSEGEEQSEEQSAEPFWKQKQKKKQEAEQKKRDAEKALRAKARSQAKRARKDAAAAEVTDSTDVTAASAATSSDHDDMDADDDEDADLDAASTTAAGAKRKAGDTDADISVNSNSNKPKKDRKKKKKTAWSAQGSGKWVYIKGVPSDCTDDELRDHMSKAGVIATDPVSQAPRLKLYRDEAGVAKGDASVCYAKEESVDLALQVLDGSQLRVGVFLEVTKAVFEQKGDKLDGARRLKVTDARVKVARAAAQQALSWNESDDSGVTSAKGGLKIVVIENMFEPADFENPDDPTFGEDLHNDIAAECEKLGPLEKITVFSRNAAGPVVVKFGTAYAAEECIKRMEGRWFGKRKLRCHYWDGITNYVVKEDDSKEQERLDEFGDWLENQVLSRAPDRLVRAHKPKLLVDCVALIST
eukprot:5866-Heterococcus_DN1.PRE.7